LATGDRIEIRFQYSHTGTSAGFTGQVNFGGATLISRSTTAPETAFDGHLDVGLASGTQSFDGQSWGQSLSFAALTGAASQNIAQNLTISFFGNMLSGSTDTVKLSNFTVLRYPAQTNP
jgi:hypothetical protein